MKSYSTNQIKNIALVGNAGSGKTTLAEAMLYEGKVIDRRGDVGSKNTVSDYNAIEHENESSIFSSVLYTEYNDCKVNIMDVPGADDFIGGAVSGLHIADSAVMVINGQNGIEVGTEIHNRWVENFGKPMIFVINHLDHDKTNFEKTVEMMKERFGGKFALTQYPVNAGPSFDTIVDIIQMKMYKFPSEGGKPEITDIPDAEMERAEELRNELIEKAAENDENLMEIFFEKETLTEDEMRKGINAGIMNNQLCPVFCSSARKSIGVGRILEFITNVLPSPDQLPAVKDANEKEVSYDPSGPATMFVFKTSHESHIGEVIFFKVMSGQITEGLDLTNSRTSNKERISQIFAPYGKNRTKVSSHEKS
jgi:elongation factor G